MAFLKKQKRPERVITKDSKENKKNKPKRSSTGFYYSFLTVILILCLIQVTVSAVLNLSKVISYRAKIAQITKTRDEARALNKQLNESIKNFSNIEGLEAIARNNLKMSSPDEVLVIINTMKEDEAAEKKKRHFWDNFKS